MFNERVQSLINSVQVLSQLEANGATLEEKLAVENVKCVNGVAYIQFNELLAEYGYCFACLCGNVVVVDALFELVSDNTKTFLILHEMGHNALNHLSWIAGMTQEEIYNTRIGYINRGEVYPMELEADRYAANIMSVELAQAALTELIKVQTEYGIIDLGEVQMRINALN